MSVPPPILSYDTTSRLGRVKITRLEEELQLDLPVRSWTGTTFGLLAVVMLSIFELFVIACALDNIGKTAITGFFLFSLLGLAVVALSIYRLADYQTRRQVVRIRPRGMLILDVSNFVTAEESIEWWQMTGFKIHTKAFLHNNHSDIDNRQHIGLRINFVDGTTPRSFILMPGGRRRELRGVFDLINECSGRQF